MSTADLASSFDYTDAPFPQPAKLSRRMRPPDLEIKASMDNRASRGDKHPKSGKRESRLAFGRLFGRHRVVTEAETLRSGRDVHNSNDSEGISETIGGVPYDLQPQGLKSEVHLRSATKDADTVTRPQTAGLKSPTSAQPFPSPTMAANGRRKGSLATTSWDPVPLFQAWPQAVRTATLPACLQADHLLRIHNKKEMLSTISHPDLGDDKDVFVAMAKKRHRRNSSSFKLDWTTKIYILVTSGYLLQYAGDGPHDCLPEKVVQLTKDSAAFASDVIPGKHWVLQVSSVFEDGALTSHDTRSLLGKFGLREKERRQASDMLMIFENAADMDSWMSLLRREIEVLGGRAPLTETGTPRQDDDQPRVESSPTSPTGRAPVIRDPNFGRIGSMPDLRWDASITFDGPELHLDATLSELMPDHTFDDNSASNSFVSQDGRQLDGLRDSSNRFSFMSAARTIITSDSSACNSPLRDSFGSVSQGSHPSDESTPVAEEQEDVQLRPNATEIDNRRQSYRTSNIFLDNNRQHPAHRQHSSLSVVQEPPNFSLPQRRRAASHTASEAVHIAHATAAPGRPPRRPRRPPPPTLGFTRPLSIVADTPSPSRLSPSNPMDSNEGFDSPAPPDSPSMFASWARESDKLGYDLPSRASSRQSNVTSFQVSITKYASMNSLRPADHSLWDDAPPRMHSPMREPPLSANDIPHDITPIEPAGLQSPTRSRSPIQRAMAAQKRASMYNLSSAPRRGSVSVFTNNTAHRSTQSDHCDDAFTVAPFKGSRLSVPGHTHSGSDGSCLSNRRSMPQLPQPALPAGPPPAPPPNKALPPIPVGKKRRSGSIPARHRVPSVVALSGGEF
ncbi:hypothetical protein N0V82_006739 [Gnomoniopsis sp. IMI 355080]|nr:hypothetical protein N0V82_006739 [Gnomoniopsis sp. IMI 355080]